MTDNTPIELAPGLSYQFIADGKIHAYLLDSMSRDAIDAWVASVKEHFGSQPEGQPILLFYDISAPKIMLSPYLRAKSVELGESHPEVSGKVALVVGDSMAARMVQGLVYLLRYGSKRDRRVFTNRAAALQWLLEA